MYKRERENEANKSIRGQMKISRNEYKYEGLKDLEVGGWIGIARRVFKHRLRTAHREIKPVKCKCP